MKILLLQSTANTYIENFVDGELHGVVSQLTLFFKNQ